MFIRDEKCSPQGSVGTQAAFWCSAASSIKQKIIFHWIEETAFGDGLASAAGIVPPPYKAFGINHGQENYMDKRISLIKS